MPFLLYRMSLFFELIKGKIFDTVSLPVDVSEVVLGRACIVCQVGPPLLTVSPNLLLYSVLRRANNLIRTLLVQLKSILKLFKNYMYYINMKKLEFNMVYKNIILLCIN